MTELTHDRLKALADEFPEWLKDDGLGSFFAEDWAIHLGTDMPLCAFKGNFNSFDKYSVYLFHGLCHEIAASIGVKLVEIPLHGRSPIEYKWSPLSIPTGGSTGQVLNDTIDGALIAASKARTK